MNRIPCPHQALQPCEACWQKAAEQYALAHPERLAVFYMRFSLALTGIFAIVWVPVKRLYGWHLNPLPLLDWMSAAIIVYLVFTALSRVLEPPKAIAREMLEAESTGKAS